MSAVALASTVLALPSPAEPLEARATSAASSSLPTVTVKGNAFYAGDDRFFIRGVDYQPGGSSQAIDPIADTSLCTRDIAKFKDLGINTVRIYTVDNSANHDECMSLLASAGIYLVLDVNTPKYSLNRASPEASYNAVYLQSIFATIDAFSKYSNTLAFFSGNEVINDDTTTNAAPYVKAVTRDMRQYIGSRGYRSIPVGYSAADVSENRMQMAHYMNCGTDDERSDFFAFNDYSWCDPSSFTTSGWDQKVKNFTGYSIPIFLSEYGCIDGEYRHFDETAALYNPEMTGVYSGGLVYEYTEEGNGYGLVKVSGSTVNDQTDYDFLKSVFAKNPAPTDGAGSSTSSTASTCPPKDANWNVTTDALPAIPEKAKSYMSSGAGTGPGLTGAGSQNAGGTSTGSAAPGSGSVTAVASGSGTATSSTASATSTKKSAAGSGPQPLERSAMMVGAVVIGFTMLGMALL
ncbi:MAG: beta-glucanosyltransferase [Claussenomyces sp. TS43310]|nr:MAG: beta-glucanosyltransferase [Claussenomyces sp. TS43310]